MSELFLKIVNMSISASWLVLAVLLLRQVLKKAPKWVSVLLWVFVALRLMMPFSIESNFSLVPDQLTNGQIISNVGDVYIGETDTIEIYDGHKQPGQQPVGSFVAEDGSIKPPKTVGNTVYPILGWIWLAGVGLMLVYTVISYILLRRKVATAVRLRKNILLSENVASPFVLGIIKPKIYLPFQMDDQSLEYVIAHEESHIRRKDHWWKPFGFVLLAIHWFNPLMWIGYILLCRDIELACDEKVIKEMDNENRANYTEALVACSINRRSIAACPLAFGEVGVKERVKSVMNYKKPVFWVVIIAIISCIVVAVCFLTNPIPHTLQTIDNYDLGVAAGDSTEVYANAGETYTYTYVGAVEQTQLQELYDIRISRKEVSQDRSEDRDQTNSLFLPHSQQEEILTSSYRGGIYIHFNADFTQVWANNDVKPTFSYKVINPEKARSIYLSIITKSNDKDLEPVETINGNPKTYYKNADGTWQFNGRTYQYRLEITGRMPNAVVDSTFVYLSNLEKISFSRAWKAAGASSNLSDYFTPEEAVLVEWITHSASTGAVDNNNSLATKPESKLDAAISAAILSQHKREYPDGLLNTESHMILVNETVSGTPLVGQTEHIQEEAFFVYYLNLHFNVQGDQPEEQDGIFGEAIITFTVDENGEYTLKNFMKPEASTDSGADYDEELIKKFVSASEDVAENEEKYSKQLLDSCWKTATDYVNNKKAASSAQPGGNVFGSTEYASYEQIREDYRSLQASIGTMTENEIFTAYAWLFASIAHGSPSEEDKYAVLVRELIDDDVVFENEEVFEIAQDYAILFSRYASGDRDEGLQQLKVKIVSTTTAKLDFAYWGEMWYSVGIVAEGDDWVTGEFTEPYKGELGKYLMAVTFHDAEPSMKFLKEYSANTDHKLYIPCQGNNHEMSMRIVPNADHGYHVYIGSDDPFQVEEQSSVKLRKLDGAVSVTLNFET